MNRRFLSLTLAALLALTGLGHSSALAAEEPGTKAEFKAAYGRYQQAIEDKDAEAAATAAGKALELGPEILADESPSLAALYVNYGMALVDAKRYEEATRPLYEGIKRLEKLNGKSHESLIEPLWALGEAYKNGSQFSDEGSPYFKRILKIIKKTGGNSSFAFAEINMEIGRTLAIRGNRTSQVRATRHFEAAHETYLGLFEGPSSKTGLSAFWLGKTAMTLRKYKTAEKR